MSSVIARLPAVPAASFAVDVRRLRAFALWFDRFEVAQAGECLTLGKMAVGDGQRCILPSSTGVSGPAVQYAPLIPYGSPALGIIPA